MIIENIKKIEILLLAFSGDAALIKLKHIYTFRVKSHFINLVNDLLYSKTCSNNKR